MQGAEDEGIAKLFRDFRNAADGWCDQAYDTLYQTRTTRSLSGIDSVGWFGLVRHLRRWQNGRVALLSAHLAALDLPFRSLRHPRSSNSDRLLAFLCLCRRSLESQKDIKLLDFLWAFEGRAPQLPADTPLRLKKTLHDPAR